MEDLLRQIRESTHSDFYRTKWGAAARFEDLPLLSVQELIDVPLRNRSYKEEKGLVKIVRAYERPFLHKSALEDLREESYAGTCERPLVLMKDNGDALEKTLWFYEHNILPLIGEPRNIPVTAYIAKTVGIDVLLCDAASLAPFLAEGKDLPLVSIDLIVIDRHFDAVTSPLMRSVRYVLGLPEAGAFATKCERSEAFHPHADSVLELFDGEMILTKVRLSTTPLIRYRTGIRATAAACPCGKDGYLLHA